MSREEAVAEVSAEKASSCRYVYEDGTSCPESVEGDSEQCFWHDSRASKEGPDVKQRLEEWGRSGRSMEGFVLRYAHLEGVKLSDQEGLNLSRANLFRANLQGASLFNIDLRGTDLLKANLAGANMNHAKMQDADLLGAVLDGTKMERVEWGNQAIQEQKALEAEKEKRHKDAQAFYEEAEEIYRNLRRVYDSAGRFDEAGRFFQKEMAMRRKLMPKWSFARTWSKLVDLFCGYGESPPRVIGFSILLVLLCALAYFVVGVNAAEGSLRFDPGAGVAPNIWKFFNCVYYSVVTFTTLGYGDITPSGFARPIAAFEAFAGAFMMALFITVFGKKMTR